MKRAVLFILISILNNHINAQWTWQNPLPQGNDLKFVKFFDDNIGWAVGNDGAIIKTTDGGDTWILQNSTTKQNLYYIFCIDKETIFVLGYQVVLKTTDGGDNWKQLKIYDSISYYYTLYFFNESTGWLSIKEAISPGESVDKIIKTTDGGLTWEVQFEKISFPVYSFSFISENEGWALVSPDNSNRILHTSDGKNWEEISIIPNRGFKIQFVTKDTGYVVTSFFLHKTTDGGKSWEALGFFNSILSFEIISENSYLILDTGKNLQVTIDGGNSWEKKQITFNDTLISCFSYFNSLDYKKGKIWAVGEMGTIAISSNFGNTWECKSKNVALSLDDIQFINKDIGWAVGSLNTVVKTHDGGSNWYRTMIEDIFAIDVENLKKVCFLKENLGWVASNHGNIYKTTDGGISWLKINVSNSPLNDVSLITENVGWAVTDCGEILKTTDGGLSWEIKKQIAASIYSLCFLDENLGWVTFIGKDENYGLTTDGGETWNLEKIEDGISVTFIQFFDQDNGWAANTIKFLRTTDGGKNWQHASFDNIMNSIFFVNKNIGWAAGEYGVIMKTTDGGISWSRLALENSLPIKSIYFISENEGWVVGKNGMIMKTSNGGATFVQEDNCDEIFTNVNKFRLDQNFPNPFNPITKIKYSIPADMTHSAESKSFLPVTLKVYDVLGRGITTLVNEEQRAGDYEINFNADKLPSGIYFYKLQSGNYISTKKMVLLK